MSLFIGNVSKKVTAQEFEDAFKSYGNCKIDLRVRTSPYRKDTPSCNMTASVAHSRPNSLSRTQISAGCDSTSSGPKTQVGSTRTTVSKTTVFAESAATPATRAGKKKSDISEGRLPTSARPPPTLKMRLRSTVSSPSVREM